MEPSNATGSRNSTGNVPNVNWNSDNDKLNVNWYNPDNRNDNIRTRAEVFEKSPLGLFLLQIFYPAVCHFRDFLEPLFKIEIYFCFYDI